MKTGRALVTSEIRPPVRRKAASWDLEVRGKESQRNEDGQRESGSGFECKKTKKELAVRASGGDEKRRNQSGLREKVSLRRLTSVDHLESDKKVGGSQPGGFRRVALVLQPKTHPDTLRDRHVEILCDLERLKSEGFQQEKT